MFKLTQAKERYVVEHKGVEIELNLYYNDVLKCFELIEDDTFEEIEKIVILFRILVREYEKYDSFDIYDRSSVVNKAFDIIKDDKKGNKSDEPEVEPYNFTHDAERIYASYLAEYDIDLLEQQKKMSWLKFIALFNSLSEESPIMKAVSYRLMDIPKAKEASREERERIKKLKKIYELPSHKVAREKKLLETMKKQRGKGVR